MGMVNGDFRPSNNPFNPPPPLLDKTDVCNVFLNIKPDLVSLRRDKLYNGRKSRIIQLK